jgi:hypothetical protein
MCRCCTLFQQQLPQFTYSWLAADQQGSIAVSCQATAAADCPLLSCQMRAVGQADCRISLLLVDSSVVLAVTLLLHLLPCCS